MLYLKVACTTLKFPDDCAMMGMHGFSFSKKKHCFSKFVEFKRITKGQVCKNNILTSSGNAVHLMVPLDRERCEYFSIIYYIFSIFLKPHA